MQLRRAAAVSLCFASLATAAFAADNASFTLVNKAGRVIGKANYSIDKKKDGSLAVRSKFEYRTGIVVAAPTADPSKDTPGGGNIQDAQYTADYKVDAKGNFVTGYTQNSANQMITSFSPSKDRNTVVVGGIQGGIQQVSRDLPMPGADYLFAPDYDPSAIQVLLLTAINHPHADHTYLLIVPGTGVGAKAGNSSVPIALGPAGDATGTLDGKPVALKKYLLKFNKSKADLYTDADGNLMEADMGPLGTNYVRNKFALTAAADAAK